MIDPMYLIVGVLLVASGLLGVGLGVSYGKLATKQHISNLLHMVEQEAMDTDTRVAFNRIDTMLRFYLRNL